MGVIYGLSLAVLTLIAALGAFAAKFRIAPLPWNGWGSSPVS